MRYPPEEAAREIRRRAEKVRRSRDDRGVFALSASAAALCALLAFCFGNICAEPGRFAVQSGRYGAMLLFGNVGSYVLAGVVAFLAGAAVAAICTRRSSGKKNRDGHKEE